MQWWRYVVEPRFLKTSVDPAQQSFAEKYPKISFTHIFPGLVNTKIASASDDWKVRMLSPIFGVIGRFAGVSPETCAEYMWHGLYTSKAGWSRKDGHGEDVPPKSISPELRNKLWEHTLEVTGR